VLREIGQYLVDVHGQSEHLSLLRVREHLGLLDRFAGVETERDALASEVLALRAVREELQRLRDGERDAARRADMLTFQINEIGAAKLKPGEDEALLEERTRLANAEQLAALADAAILALDEGSQERVAATDLVGEAERPWSHWRASMQHATRRATRCTAPRAVGRSITRAACFMNRSSSTPGWSGERLSLSPTSSASTAVDLGNRRCTGAQREMEGITHR
jgi:DNA repair ATPase RecN